MLTLLQRLLRPGWAARLFLVALLSDNGGAHAGEFQAEFAAPSLDRWMYPFNATPGSRPAAPAFGTFGDAAGVDTRHGQFVLAWGTAAAAPPNLPAWRYLVKEARLTLATLREGSFVNDSTADPFESYLPADDPRHQPDTDAGRPVELFGTGFRNGFTAATFLENSAFGGGGPGERNAFAAGFNERGEFVDVGNHVGKTNEAFLPFPTRPFAVGVLTNVPAGEPVPADTPVTFTLNLADPLTLGYVQAALATGRLWLTATWLGESGGLGGTPAYPDFATRENVLYAPPHLVIEGTWISDEDTDNNGLPDDWERFYFGGRGRSAADDPDQDGADNFKELAEGTDPNSATSVLWVQLTSVAVEGGVTLRFPVAASRDYVVEQSVDLREWSPASGSSRFASVGEIAWLVDLPATAAGFFRVRAMPR